MLRRYEIESAQDHTDQQDVIAALASGDLLAGNLLGIVDKQPRHIETHCSHVFLTADRAFKLKKAIAFSYLDYRSVAARERFIRAELELNRRTAPQLYLNRHKIARRPGGGLMLAPPEDPAPAIDWLLEMRRFPDDALLADHAEQQGLAPDLIRDLADAIHDFHLSAEQRPDHGSAEETEHVLLECLDNLRLRVPPLDRRSVVNLAAELTTQFGLHASLIDQRRIAGFVRHCHGDLHLGNICLIDGKPVLFDCIDFSEMLSCIDVAYDLAFLLMDLCHRGHRDQASLLVNRWIDRTGDTASLTLLPFFQSLRAAIRAHILATSHRDSEATAYLDSAARHLQPAAPRLIAIGGLSGSGKSTLARGIALDYRPLPGARIIRSDSLRKRLAGVAPETRLPAESYTQRMSDRVYAMMLTEARQVLAAGYTAIIDAAFLRAGERQAIDALAAELRVPCHGLWLDVPAAILADRLAQRRNDASDADRTVLDKQLSLDLGPMTWQRVAAAGDAASNLTTLRQALAPASAQR